VVPIKWRPTLSADNDGPYVNGAHKMTTNIVGRQWRAVCQWCPENDDQHCRPTMTGRMSVVPRKWRPTLSADNDGSCVAGFIIVYRIMYCSYVSVVQLAYFTCIFFASTSSYAFNAYNVLHRATCVWKIHASKLKNKLRTAVTKERGNIDISTYRI